GVSPPPRSVRAVPLKAIFKTAAEPPPLVPGSLRARRARHRPPPPRPRAPRKVAVRTAGQARRPEDARLCGGTLRRARPGDRGPARPCARGRGQPRAQRRAETMSAETASGPTEDQVEILEYNFNKVNKHPDPTTLCLIAAEAGLSEEETQKWFKQRLAQWRRSEGLPSECRSVTD
uniref:Homeodomain-only protein n=1 Tax=Felis catus TaxID=9685 RepID=A0ABI7W0N3_FELCA